MVAKCFLVGFLNITSPVSRKPRMWSPTYTGTALSERPANQVTVRVVESGSRDTSVCALKHAARALLKRARIDARESRSSFPWCAGEHEVPADIKRQTHGFAESTFVIFENLRARKMSYHFLIRGSGSASLLVTPCEAVRLVVLELRIAAHITRGQTPSTTFVPHYCVGRRSFFLDKASQKLV